MMEFMKSATALRKYRQKTKISYSFLDFDDHNVSFATIYDEGVQLGSWLIRQNWTMEMVGIIGRLNRFSCRSYLACIMAGSTSFPLDSKEVAMFYQIRRAKVKTIIIDLNTLVCDVDLSTYDCIERILTFGVSKFKVKHKCLIYKAEECIDFEAETTKKAFERVLLFEPQANKQTIVTLTQTSGSTGPPKIILYTNKTSMTFLKNNSPFSSWDNLKKFYQNHGLRGLYSFYQIFKNPSACCSVNYNGLIQHTILSECLASPLQSNFLITAGDDMESLMRNLIKYKPSIAGCYTPKIFELVNTKCFKEAKDLSFLKLISIGGAQFSEAMYQRIASELKTKQSKFFFVRNSYGATETGGVLWATDSSDPIQKAMTSVGKFTHSEGFKYRIEDENGQECPNGVPGEIVVFSPVRMQNYLKDIGNEPVTWIRMGDEGYVDADGYLYLVGRMKDTICLKNAKKINALLVENLIDNCDKIIEVSVKGLPNNEGYDDIHAFICTDATKEEIIEYCIYNLPYTYLPKIHVQKEPLPKLPNGKYNKHLMLRLKGLSSG